MYRYHPHIKKRIREGEMTGFRFVPDYPRIGECIVLEFITPPFTRPIRPHRYAEYTGILEEWSAEHEH